ncbi:hypothetical protein JCM3765_007756 [Sporobolomyces pararoseus]
MTEQTKMPGLEIEVDDVVTLSSSSTRHHASASASASTAASSSFPSSSTRRSTRTTGAPSGGGRRAGAGSRGMSNFNEMDRQIGRGSRNEDGRQGTEQNIWDKVLDKNGGYQGMLDPANSSEAGGGGGGGGGGERVEREDRAREETLDPGQVQQTGSEYIGGPQPTARRADSGREEEEEEDPNFGTTPRSDTYLSTTIDSSLYHSRLDSGSTSSQLGYCHSQASSLPVTTLDSSVRDMSLSLTSNSSSLTADNSQAGRYDRDSLQEEVEAASEEDEEPVGWIQQNRNLAEQALIGDRTVFTAVRSSDEYTPNARDSRSMSPITSSGGVARQLADPVWNTTPTPESARPSPPLQDSTSSLSPYVSIADGPLARLSTKQQVLDSRSVSRCPINLFDML